MDNETRGRWLYATGKHVTRYQQGYLLTHVYATQRASQEGDLLLRLRRLTRVPAKTLTAFARDCGLPRQEVGRSLDAFAAMNLVEVEKNRAGELVRAENLVHVMRPGGIR